MTAVPRSPHVLLAKAVERILYVGDYQPPAIHRSYINQPKLEQLEPSSPYFAIVLGPRTVNAKESTRDAIAYLCQLSLQFVFRVDAEDAAAVDTLLELTEANLDRCQTTRLEGVQSLFVPDSIVVNAYDEPLLRDFGIFASRINAAWIVTQPYEVT